MDYRLIQKKNELLEKYPSEAGKNLYDFNLSQFNRSAPPTYGIVLGASIEKKNKFIVVI